MARRYIPRRSDYTAGGTLPPGEWRDQSDAGIVVSSEAITVPSSADADGFYRVRLDQRPRVGTLTVTRTSGGVVLTIVGIDTAPTANQVGVDYERGILRFPSSAAGGAHTASYTGEGSVALAESLIRIEAELSGALSREAAAAGRNLAVVYLSEGGSDSTGNGSVDSPYRTVNKAIEVINASAETDWAVVMGPGQYVYTTANALPALGGTKRVAWIGAGRELTNLHCNQPSPGSTASLISGATLSFVHLSDLFVTSVQFGVEEVEIEEAVFENQVVQKALTIQSPDNLTRASMMRVRVVAPDSGQGVRSDVFTDGSISDSILDLTTLRGFASGDYAGSVSNSVVTISASASRVTELVNCTVTSFAGLVRTIEGSDVSGFTGTAERAISNWATAGSLRAHRINGHVGINASITHAPDSNNEWHVQDVRLEFTSGTPSVEFVATGGSTLYRTMWQNVHIRSRLAFNEPGTGMVNVIYMLRGTHDFEWIGGSIDTLGIPIMVSHSANDDNRTLAKNVTLRGVTLRMTRAATAGPADPNSCLVLRNRGTVILEDCRLETIVAASTNTTNEHCPISWRSDTGAADGTAVLVVRNCSFRTTLPAGAITNGKASVLLLSDFGTETVNATFEGMITVEQDGNQQHTFRGLGGSRLVMRCILTSSTAITFQNGPSAGQITTILGTPAIEDSAAWAEALGLVVGLDVQAYSSNLAAIAAIVEPYSGNITLASGDTLEVSAGLIVGHTGP